MILSYNKTGIAILLSCGFGTICVKKNCVLLITRGNWIFKIYQSLGFQEILFDEHLCLLNMSGSVNLSVAQSG